MPLTLEDYDHKVGHHLRMIRHHAAAIDAHVAYMTHQPAFEALAEDELAKVDATLAQAMGKVRHAIETYRGKPHDT